MINMYFFFQVDTFAWNDTHSILLVCDAHVFGSAAFHIRVQSNLVKPVRQGDAFPRPSYMGSVPLASLLVIQYLP